MKTGIVALIAVVLSACAHSHRADQMPQMCSDYRQQMAGKTVAEQRAAAAAHIKAMHGSADDAHIDRHLKMMGERCGVAPAR